MTDFEQKVLSELSEIKVTVATTAQAQTDHSRRIDSLETYNATQESRHWWKSALVGPWLLLATRLPEN